MSGDATAGLSRRDAGLITAGLALLLATGAGGEYLTAGLNDPEALRRACERLERVPAVIGPWISQDLTLDERERRLAQIAGCVRREYRHQETGYQVLLTLLCGPSGPISVHPPTTCFQGIGYSLSNGPHDVRLPCQSSDVSLSKAVFRAPEGHAAEHARVFWGWSTDGLWSNPANPRLAFRGNPALYKLYVVDYGISASSELKQSEAFLADALPVIREALQK